MSGNTMGLGAGITAHSFFRIVAEDAVWAMPNTLYGIYSALFPSLFYPFSFSRIPFIG